MDLFNKLYDEHEQTKVRFVGFHTDDVRYDFGMIYTDKFFGKPLVVCMQTGKSALLDADDVENLAHLQKIFNIASEKEAADLATFFAEELPHLPLKPQYE